MNLDNSDDENSATDKLQRTILHSEQSMLEDLRLLVTLETPSMDVQRLNHCRDWLESWIARRLGDDIECLRSSNETYGDTITAYIPSRTEASSGHSILVVGHYDTVWPAATLEDLPFVIDGDKISGPGVFDMKGGIIQAIWAIKALRDNELAMPDITLVLNPDEEVGSISSRSVIEEAGATNDLSIIMEPSADGAFKTSRRGAGIFRATFRGVEAHAGVEPDKGASAITALGEFISYANNLASQVKGTSINVGTVHGGTATNVLAGEAIAGLDIRIADIEEKARIENGFLNFVPSDSRVIYNIDCAWNRPPMEKTTAIASAFERVRKVAASMNLNVRDVHSGGFSDGNLIAAMGKPVIDGFGAVGAGAHHRTEYCLKSGMFERTILLARFILESTSGSDSTRYRA